VASRRAPSAFEREVLDILLRELRSAMRARAQLTVIIDPWTAGGGTYIGAFPNEEGRSYEVEQPRGRAKQ